MKRLLLAVALAGTATTTTAPGRALGQAPAVPGYVAFTLAGVGGQTAVSGESRLPVRLHDAAWDGAALRVRAAGVRGSVREVAFTVPGAAAGRRSVVGEGGAQLAVQFASGNTMSPAAGHGWVEVAEIDAQHATGSFEATLSQGRLPLVIRGTFEARYAGP